MTSVVSPDTPPPALPALAQLGLGEILAGKYRVEELIGSGGMGLVVAATHIELDQKVAIKMMNKEALSDPESRVRFAREARATVKLKSQHVARVHDVGTLDDGAPYLVMEYLDGSDLQTVIFEYGQLLPHEAVAYMLQACEAVAEAHGLGIVHRDLKPRNLFVTTGVDGSPLVKVLDFGISKFVRQTGDTVDLGLTKTQDVIGSPSYMAPEQLRAAKHATERSDIWSLGVILFETITGQLPWQAESVSELTAMVFRDPPRKMRDIVGEAPAGLEAIVEKCLEKDPEKRFANVEEFAHALEPFANGLSTGAAARIESVARTTKRPPGVKAALDRGSAGSARLATRATGGTSVSWGETEPMPPAKASVPPPASTPRAKTGIALFGAAFVATFVLAIGGYFLATRGARGSAASPLPEDRGANRPPATATASPPSSAATPPVAPIATTATTGVGSAPASPGSTTSPIATVPRKATPAGPPAPRVEAAGAGTAGATALAPPVPNPSPPAAAKADPHDLGSVGRK